MALDTPGVKCRARYAIYTPDDPPDCGWPFCGCDQHAEKVVQSLQECGWEDASILRGALKSARRHLVTLGGEPDTEHGDALQRAVLNEIDITLGEST